MRWFVRQSKKVGRVCAFIQYCKSKHFDDNKRSLLKELGVKGNIYDIIEEHFRYKKKHYEIVEKKYENQFNDYRLENEEDEENYI